MFLKNIGCILYLHFKYCEENCSCIFFLYFGISLNSIFLFISNSTGSQGIRD